MDRSALLLLILLPITAPERNTVDSHLIAWDPVRLRG